MNFLEHIFERMAGSAERPVLREIRGETLTSVSGGALLAQVSSARTFFQRAGLQKGDRCGLVGNNSIRWVALDLALMAEGIVVVPLYSRQSPAELVAIINDCTPRLLCCGDSAMAEAIAALNPSGPKRVLFDEICADSAPVEHVSEPPKLLAPRDTVTIIYTSGTSGQAKGACLTVGNLNHMLGCTTSRLNDLMGTASEPDHVYHYLPFNFAGSWILLLSCLSRTSVLSLSTDLNKLAEEIGLAAPHYFLNVPTLLERVRKGVQENLRKRGGLALKAFENTWDHHRQSDASRRKLANVFWRMIATRLVFPKVRARFGKNLRALICGSAPLSSETQLFFNMLGMPVLQVYGLTETTGICTMDDPTGRIEPGFVGPAIPGVEMTCGEDQEILVRGPNIFPGYWNRPEETAAVLRDGWFHTGDQGEVSDSGNWRIVGRIKNLLILNSGHNIAPEPIEQEIVNRLPGAQQIILVGNGRGYLTALIAPAASGQLNVVAVNGALEAINRELPHYKQVRAFHILREPLSIESGLLTANGKIKRDAIAARFAPEIEALYQRDAREKV